MRYRLEYDTMGAVEVPYDKYWGAQTQRSLNNFEIGEPASMPESLIYSMVLVKKAAAMANMHFNVLDAKKAHLIIKACDAILDGKYDDNFPLVIWQTGSGTQTNMNVNEVIVNVAQVISGGSLEDKHKILHPNDDVNMSQSSNDTFPTAMSIAVYKLLTDNTILNVTLLRDALNSKAEEYSDVRKVGRTHLMDAAPLTLGQEFSGYVSQLDHALAVLRFAMQHLSELAIGGTAVGTGQNAPEGFAGKVAKIIAGFTDMPFVSAANKFEAISANDAMVEISSALKITAVSLLHITNNIRFLASGPRCGIGEIILPANEPGSSIMPGKVNPTQNEALAMVCSQVIGNDIAVTTGGLQGHFQLNTFKPLMVHNVLESARLLGDACKSFAIKAVNGITPNYKKIKHNLENNLMMVTALSPYIGYDNAAKIAKMALSEEITLRQAASELGLLSPEKYDELMSSCL